jgi:hypothetical protein
MKFAKEKSIHVEAPPEAVFDYVSDIKRHPEWAKHPMVMREIGDGTFESTVKVMHLEPRTIISVESKDRPRRFTFICNDDTAGKYRWTFDITPSGDGSMIRYSLERLEAPTWVKLTQPWMLWPIDGRTGVLTGLANIKREMESAKTKPAVGHEAN